MREVSQRWWYGALGLALSALLLPACSQPEQNIVTAKDCIVPAGQEPPPECLDQAEKKENRGTFFLGVDNGPPDAKTLDARTLQSECADWNAEWFHHFSSPELVRVCLQTGRAEINQTDGQGRTLLHRIADDLHKDEESFYDSAAEHWIDGVRSTEERRALVRHILSWEQYRRTWNSQTTPGRLSYIRRSDGGDGRLWRSAPINQTYREPDIAAIDHAPFGDYHPRPFNTPEDTDPIRNMQYRHNRHVRGPSGRILTPAYRDRHKIWGSYTPPGSTGRVEVVGMVGIIRSTDNRVYKMCCVNVVDIVVQEGDSGALVAYSGTGRRHVAGVLIAGETGTRKGIYIRADSIQTAFRNARKSFHHYWGTKSNYREPSTRG